MRKTLLTLAVAAATIPALVLAQGMHSRHGNHGAHHQQQTSRDASPSTQAYEAANDRMHQEMMIEFTGDADIDFLAGMIPHHRGALDMAAVVLQYGKDPQVRALAQQIIAEQEREILLMEEMLQRLNK